MNRDLLLQHFDRISEAPDAVPRLRRFILDLAVRGKLVEQDPNDEPAAELLKRIEAEKALLTPRRQDAKKGKKEVDSLGALASWREMGFDLPAGWSVAYFEEVFTLEYGDNLPADKRSNTGEYPVYGSNGVVGSHDVCFVNSPCVVVGRKGSAGALNLSLTKGCCVTDVAYYCIPPRGLDLVFTFRMFHTLGLDTLGKGVKPGLSRNEAYQLPIAIPPLAEQHRIVAKVDELMALCDQLEAARNEREAQRDRLVAASLHRIGTAPAVEGEDQEDAQAVTTLPAAARFHLDHLPRLTTRVEHIKQLRQTILNLAVRGRLVPQDANDEPAAELLKRIQAEKARLMMEGQIRASKLITEQGYVQPPFQLPTNWEWVRFGDLIEAADSGWSPKTEGFPRSGEKWGVLKVSAVSWGNFLPEENKQLLPGVVPPETATVNQGDFLISRANTSELVAKCVVVEDDPKKLILSDKIVRLQLANESNKKFLCMVNNFADHARDYYAHQASGTSLSMKNVSRQVIYSLQVPLPPLAEQHRIVAKVDELMALCDQLEAQITSTETDSHRLLEAVLRDALAPTPDEAVCDA